MRTETSLAREEKPFALQERSPRIYFLSQRFAHGSGPLDFAGKRSVLVSVDLDRSAFYAKFREERREDALLVMLSDEVNLKIFIN